MSRLLCLALTCSLAHAQTPPEERVVAFAAKHVGKRVGGGECVHLAVEALRSAGAKFVRPPDAPAAGDYVWGKLVATLEPNAAPKAKARPGDVLQYRDTRFRDGSFYPHHTSIVAAVDAAGRPTAVYEENIGPPGMEDRTVRKTSLDFAALSGGWVRVYRPEPRARKARHFEFTLVNKTPDEQAMAVHAGGTKLYGHKLTREDTANSHMYAAATVSGVAAPTLVVGTTRVAIADGAGYEIVAAGGKVSVRRLP